MKKTKRTMKDKKADELTISDLITWMTRCSKKATSKDSATTREIRRGYGRIAKALRDARDAAKPNGFPVRVAAAMGRSNEDGLKPFCVVTPSGVPDVRVYAKSAEAARKAVESWIYNELDGAEDIECYDE